MTSEEMIAASLVFHATQIIESQKLIDAMTDRGVSEDDRDFAIAVQINNDARKAHANAEWLSCY